MNDGFIACPAPAKLNLFLHVTGRRADGYHLLQSAFRMVDHGDTLAFRCREDAGIERLTDIPGVPQESDLVVRAARLLQTRTNCRLGADIRIEKHLPMGGGLGGGSSDAATTLLALNRLWGLDLPRKTLQDWALELGADVPFFVFGRTALAEGVGEALEVLDLPPAWYVVVEPGVAVPTVEIFRADELTRNTKPIIIAGFAANDRLALIENDCRNDLQAVACKLYPPVKHALEALEPYGVPRMSGSGSCVFLPCTTETIARQVTETVGRVWKAWYAPALDRHPLHAWAKD